MTKKYLYWQAENRDFLILVRDWKVKEMLKTEFNFFFIKVKTKKKPIWFNKETYGYIFNKGALKQSLLFPMPRLEFKKDKILTAYAARLFEPKFIFTGDVTA